MSESTPLADTSADQPSATVPTSSPSLPVEKIASIVTEDEADAVLSMQSSIGAAPDVRLFHFDSARFEAGHQPSVAKPAKLLRAFRAAREAAGDHHVWCSLPGILTLAFRDRERGEAAAKKLTPSFNSIGRTGAVYLTYRFTDDAEDVSALATDLMEDDTDEAYTAHGFPLAYGDVSRLDQDGKPVTIAEFEAAFFGGDGGGGKEASELSADAVGEENDYFVMSDGRRFEITAERDRVGGSPTETWNDAEVYGELDEGLLDTLVQVANGEDEKEKKWKTTPARQVRGFFDDLTRHVVGKKVGRCFVPGALAGPQRTNNAVTKMCLMGIDVDSGESLVETAQKIQDAGLCALIYSTHSHGTTKLEIKQDKFFKWASDNGHNTNPTTVLVKEFLRKEAKYKPDVIDSAVFESIEHLRTGVQIVVRTRPIDKFRIVFPLASEYVLSKQGMAQKDAIKQWGDMILGMGRMLGSGLIGHSQKMTVAARAMAEKKAIGHLS